jgi:hypothetical protein
MRQGLKGSSQRAMTRTPKVKEELKRHESGVVEHDNHLEVSYTNTRHWTVSIHCIATGSRMSTALTSPQTVQYIGQWEIRR